MPEIEARIVGGKRLGTGEWYHWAQCDVCDHWFDLHLSTHRESEHIQCGECSRGLQFGRTFGKGSEGNLADFPLDIPTEYMQCSLDGFPKPFVSKVRNWPVRTPFIAVAGQTGRGKTWASYARGREVVANKRAVIAIYEPNARSEWIGLMNDARARLTGYWKKAPTLIVDDLGHADASNGWQGAIDEVISHRITYHKATLINTKLNGNDLKAKYGPSLGSRLSGHFIWAFLGGPDRRHTTTVLIPELKTPEPLFK